MQKYTFFNLFFIIPRIQKVWKHPLEIQVALMTSSEEESRFRGDEVSILIASIKLANNI